VKSPNPRPFIPFNRPYIDRRAVDAVGRVIDSGRLSGDGPVCKEVEASLRNLLSVKHVLLTTSGTHALEMAMMLLDLKPGDEVILPSFTFVSTANAILRCGGTPVFCEIEDRTFTMDPDDVTRRISSRTRAIIPVHYAGIPAQMDRIGEIAGNHNCLVIEDAAQGVNATYRGRYQGTIGNAGALSFHDTKNYVAGEGGAFLTNDEHLGRRAEIIREKGTNRANFLRGEVDRYTWVELGSSYILSDILAAILKCQLTDFSVIRSERERVHQRYITGLRDLEQKERLRLPVIPAYCESNYHIFPVLLRTEADRDAAIRRMKEAGIGTTFHYVPLHSSPYACRVLGTSDLRLPVTDRISGTLLRLPIYPRLTDSDVDYIVEDRKSVV
jgi:dTDP-4-amino-4,6-dideoxygalactose transaminase